MTPTPNGQHQSSWRSHFLLKVQVETAPVATVFEAMEELRELLAQIAAANRFFLEEISRILQQSKDVELRQRAAVSVRLGLLFDDTERLLDALTAQIRFHDEQSLIAAARIAQQWGWLALGLRDELSALSAFVRASNPAARD